ncbi:hypothetical protein EIP91_010064 [Steccherinum ochraceum]|uniref:C2 domain-containing protein n=1 Tax=Steccherinum ochraceum TaxID=92696 RepID=A0A4V2MV65_9APHY|nr:hypothetical protein EIP91_010064 [Steccherinum ochraceum]
MYDPPLKRALWRVKLVKEVALDVSPVQHVISAIHLASDLSPGSQSGRSSLRCYVKVITGTAEYHTKVADRDVEPYWDESFEVPSLHDNIHLNLKHKSHLGRSTLLGSAVVKYADLRERQEQEADLGRPGPVQCALLDALHRSEIVGYLLVSTDYEALTARHRPTPSTFPSIDASRSQGSQVGEDGRYAMTPGLSSAGWRPGSTRHSQSLSATSHAVATASNAVENARLDRTSGGGDESDNPVVKSAKDLLKSVGESLTDILDLGDTLSQLHPIAGVAWKVISCVGQAIHAQADRDAAIIDLLSVMADSYAFVGPLKRDRVLSAPLTDVIDATLKLTIACAGFIQEYCKSGFVGRLSKQSLNNRVKLKIEDFKQRFASVQLSRVEGTAVETLVMTKVIHRNQVLNGLLQIPSPAHPDRPACLPLTRTELIKEISEWLCSPPQTGPAQSMLWLRGLPGSGKSTVMTTLVNIYRAVGWLGACIVFPNDEPHAIAPSLVIRTIAAQLGQFDDAIAQGVIHAVDQAKDVTDRPLAEQFNLLLIGPLKALGNDHRVADGPVVIVLDGLNNCGDAKSRKDLLSVLMEHASHLPSWLRVIITSREERDIVEALDSSQFVASTRIDIASESNKADILTYLRHNMRQIRDAPMNKTLALPQDWPGESAIQQLADRAAGLFFWAATACSYIDAFEPKKRMQAVLEGSSGHAELHTLYGTMLRSLGDWKDDGFTSSFHTVIGAVITTKEPLTHKTIVELLERPSAPPIVHALKALSCVLSWHPEEPLRILHPSFKEYVTNPEHCQSEPWFIDVTQHRRTLALRCLRLVTTKPLPDNPQLVVYELKKCLSPGLLYACRYWVNYVCSIEHPCEDIFRELEPIFGEEIFIRWFTVVKKIWAKTVAVEIVSDFLSWGKAQVSVLTRIGPSLKQLETLLHRLEPSSSSAHRNVKSTSSVPPPPNVLSPSSIPPPPGIPPPPSIPPPPNNLPPRISPPSNISIPPPPPLPPSRYSSRPPPPLPLSSSYLSTTSTAPTPYLTPSSPAYSTQSTSTNSPYTPAEVLSETSFSTLAMPGYHVAFPVAEISPPLQPKMSIPVPLHEKGLSGAEHEPAFRLRDAHTVSKLSVPSPNGRRQSTLPVGGFFDDIPSEELHGHPPELRSIYEEPETYEHESTRHDWPVFNKPNASWSAHQESGTTMPRTRSSVYN